MKTALTKEESEHLLKLGVPQGLAHSFEYIGKICPDISERGCSEPLNVYAPIFKIENFLDGEILPKWIGDMNLCIQPIPEGVWYVAYGNAEKELLLSWKISPELIDALYRLACWYYGEYLKNKEK